MNIIAHSLIQLTLCLLISACCNAAQSPNNSPLEALAKQAEERYKKSSADKHTQQQQVQEPKVTPPPTPPAPATKKEKQQSWSLAGMFKHSEPVLAKHKQFSDDWWSTLFERCEGAQDPDEDIDGWTIVQKNPQWREVNDMSREAKQIVMERALRHIGDHNGPCRVACAVSVGADPNARAKPVGDESEPHLALHFASGLHGYAEPHFGLYRFLLQRGANANAYCIRAPVMGTTMNQKFRHELMAHGARPLSQQQEDELIREHYDYKRMSEIEGPRNARWFKNNPQEVQLVDKACRTFGHVQGDDLVTLCRIRESLKTKLAQNPNDWVSHRFYTDNHMKIHDVVTKSPARMAALESTE